MTPLPGPHFDPAPGRPRAVIACGSAWAAAHLHEDDLRRLEERLEVETVLFDDGDDWQASYLTVSDSAADRKRLEAALAGASALILGPGSPKVDGPMLEAGSGLSFVGELEGDRFSPRLDLEAAWERGLVTVDTTNGSSYPVAEWALAALILSFRNAGAMFREMIAPQAYTRPMTDAGFIGGGIEGREIALIGCGHIGRRLLRYLRPFGVRAVVHDPYLSPTLADELDVTLTTLERAFEADAVVCLVPSTPMTNAMIHAALLDRLRPGSVFVNVSRGQVVDSDALVSRLSRGDVIAALDVFDPEPIPADHPVKSLPNVFLTPHISGVTASSRLWFFRLMVDEATRHLEGHQCRYQLTPAVARARGVAGQPKEDNA